MNTTPERALKRIETPLRLTLIGLWAERLTIALWPLWTITIAAIAAAAFGVQDELPLEAAWAGMVAIVLALFWAIVHGIRAFRRPTRTEAMVRLDARLPGQPIAALLDSQAIGATDPASQAVWAAHRARMATRAASARPVEPNLRLSTRDPYALRYVALTALVMAVLFGSLWRVTSVAGLTPGAAAAASGPAWEGWAQPPQYTGKPTLYLNDQTAEALTLPTGTRLQVRLYGEAGSLILSETVSGRTDPAAASEPNHDFLITKSGALSIEGDGGRDWKVIATPDAPPSVTPEATIGREADGRFKQGYTASDDYGVLRGQVIIALDMAAVDRRFGLTIDPEAVAPVILDLSLPVKGKRDTIKSTFIDDLSQHVFANLPVTLTYSVTDAAGQTGIAQPISVTLPGRRFFDPLAAALVEMRRDLLWHRANAPRVVQILRAITYKPEDIIRNERAYLRLRVALKRLETESANLPTATRDEIAEELWQIALLVEEGDLASAQERLRRAQDRLDEAIRRGASPEEIQELMDEMRQALDNYMSELAEESERKGEEQTSESGPSIEMSQDQLQQMLDKLQQLMEEGKTAEAAELMEQLRQFMENMQVTQGEGSGKGGPGQQAMKDLGETLRNQQKLSDDAFRDLQDGQEGNEGEQPGDGQDGKSLAERQQALRDRLEGLNKDGKLPGKGSENGQEGQQELDRAGRAMDDAEQALRDGNLPEALDKQAEAMDAMREGIKNFGDALAQENQRDGEPGSQQAEGQEQRDGSRDPLGRNNGESSRIGSDKNLLQGEDVYRRAQDLLDEIRKRSGEQARPEGERNYLKRLLDLF
jgi:uncharacterized protein (TIGR02302 family)